MSANHCHSEEPTDRQREVLGHIRDHQARHGYGISFRGLCDKLEVRSTNTVNDHVKALMRKGFLEKDPMVARCLRLTPRAERLLRSFPPSSADGRTTFKHTGNAARQVNTGSPAVNNGEVG